MPPKNKGYDSQTTLRLPSDLKKECEKLAEIESMSLNDWIVWAMRDRLLLANGKDITPAVTGTPSQYQELHKTINRLQEQINEIKNSPLLGDVVIRRTAAENISNKFYNQIKEEKGRVVNFTIKYIGSLGECEAVALVTFINDNKEKEEEKKEIPSKMINAEILKHGSELLYMHDLIEKTD